MEDKKKDLNIFFHDKKLEGYPLVMSRQPFFIYLFFISLFENYLIFHGSK